MNQTIKAAARGTISDGALGELRAMQGVEFPIPQYNELISNEAVQHYVLGIGDDNPRWIDPVAASATRWNSIIAMPTMVMSCGFARSKGLSGVHALFTGIDLHCHAPIRVGTRVKASTALHDLIERHGRYAGREFQQISVTRYRDNENRTLSTLYSHAFRTERKAGKSVGKYSDLSRQVYTDEMLKKIEADYDRERKQRRGAATLHWEDVKVGDPVSSIVKGPLTVTDCICFLMGFGYIYVKAHRQWHEFRQRHPGAGVKDNYGVWDVPERVHWEEDLAQQIGMPTMYDYGPQRIGWFDHCVSDWMGNDGWMRRLQVKVTAPNFIGDTTWIRGEVTGISPEVTASDAVDPSGEVALPEECGRCGMVELKLWAEDQRGRVTATGNATVALPRR